MRFTSRSGRRWSSSRNCRAHWTATLFWKKARRADTPDPRLPETPYPGRDGARLGSGDHDRADRVAAPGDLRSHLRAQLDAAPLHPRDRLLAERVIGALDEAAICATSLPPRRARYRSSRPPDAAELAVAVACVPALEPAGIAAREVCECLMLQLAVGDAEPGDRALAETILGEHLELLARPSRLDAARRLRSAGRHCREASGPADRGRQSGAASARPAQSPLRRTVSRPGAYRAPSGDGAAAAGSTLAAAQRRTAPGDHRARRQRRPAAAAAAAARDRPGTGSARVDGIAGDRKQVHGNASRSLRTEVLFLA